jgi:predicted nucleic acid-binding protein
LNVYADTSFFVSLYIRDYHSVQARTWVGSEPSVWLTHLHVAEWVHAVEQHVFRGQMSASEAARIHARFSSDRDGGLWLEESLPESSYSRCAELARRYAAKIGVRTLDTLHVAIALELNATDFWTFDERQQELAKAVGLKVR